MMRTATALLFSLLFVAACGGHENTASTTAPAHPDATAAIHLTPEQLGELGAQIQKNPDRADQLLKHHGFTPESFEAAIRKVTENADASRRYAVAYRRASA